MRHVADLQWEAPILQAAKPIDHLSNVRSRENWEILYIHYQKI